MEMELNSLIDKIKKDGVEEAEREAEKIILSAKEEAAGILKRAMTDKQNILSDAKNGTEKLEKASLKALDQAARDVMLDLREKITEFFESILKEKVSKSLSVDVLKDVISKAVAGFRKDGIFDIEILVNEKERNALEKTLFKELKQETKEAVSLKGSQKIKNGFRIGEKGKNSYLDFTDEAIAEAFKKYLNPKLVKILNIDLGLGKDRKSGK